MGCQSTGTPQRSPQTAWQTLSSRDEGLSPYTREPLYRAKVPTSWIQLPQESLSITDTKLPLVAYEASTSKGVVRIALHNFPAHSLKERIPPEAQVARWVNQLQPNSHKVTPLTQNGFYGLHLQGSNVEAWAMQMAPALFQTLLHEGHLLAQMRADYTIKATGSGEALREASNDLHTFANSFELIHAIPSP